jgi:4-methylaminobutanoate oxidase (formaldehyde-forming)
MAVRDTVGMYDLTSMHNYLVQGADAEASLQRICANDVAVPVGQVVYTPILNERGGFESDVTVTRFAEDAFCIVTALGTGVRDFDYIQRRIPEDARATVTDVTHGYAMLAIMGPQSRRLLSKLTDADLSNAAFPFRTAQQIDLGYARPWALRVTYVGELGWELYIPSGFAVPVFDAIMEAGKEFGLRLVGMQAVNSLRMESGYRHWETEIGPEDTPYEAGLAFGVRLDKGDFIGRDALLRQKQKGISRKLVIFTVDDPEPLLLRSEPVYRNGEHVSETTSGAYAFKLGTSIGMGYLSQPGGITNDWILSGKYEILVEGKKYPARVHMKSPYDPRNERPKM